jgi:hypothetical protein
MSQQFDNTNRGVLIKTSKAGAKFMSLSVKPKGENMSKAVPPAAKPRGTVEDLESDIPF